MTSTAPAWDAVVLAGGAAARMDGVDKTSLLVGGTSLLERVLTAVAAAARVVVVGPPRPTTAAVTWCREDPPLSGPAAALGAALPHVKSPVVVVLAADQPFVDAALVDRLVTAVGGSDGAVAVVSDGPPQWVCSAWRTEALARVDLVPGASLRRTVGSLRWRAVPVDGAVAVDCDTPDDLRRARELAT